MDTFSRRALLPLTALASLALVACGSDPATTADVAQDTAVEDGDGAVADTVTPPPTHGVVGGEDTDRISVSDDPAALLTLTRGDGAAPVVVPLDGLQLGLVPALDEERAYDPWFLYPDVFLSLLYTPLEGLTWQPATAVQGVVVDADGQHAVVTVTFGERGAGALEVTRVEAGRFDLRWTAPEATAGALPVFFRLTATVSESERYYGLGEHFDQVEQRGRVRAMQLEPAATESGYNEAHVPVPLLIGTDGWGLYVDSARPGVFDVAASADDALVVTYGLGGAHADGLRFHLFLADHPLDITRFYYDLTGKPGDVPAWAFGPWLWRDEVDGQAAVEEDLETIRALDLATSGYWIDRPYASAVNSFDFEPTTYPDPTAMMAKAADLGFAMALWHTPYLDPQSDVTRPAYDAAEAAGYFAPLMGTALAKWGPPIDYTNPAAVAYWQAQLTGYRDLGVIGYKLDYAEEVVVGAAGVRFPWRFHDGTDELTMHRGYQLGYHRTYREMLPEAGGFLLCRAGVAGDQVHGTIIWPGDIDADMSHFGEEVTEDDGDTHVAVGGLPAAVIAGSSLGASGFPLFAADTGGYRHTPPDRETFIRWIEQSALSPVMQVGTNSNDMPWSLGPDHADDPELLGIYRRYARLHMRLVPYLYALWDRTRSDGRAIQRPLGLAHPELGVHPDDIYLLGDDLLVAPVVAPSVTERSVPLPSGDWVDWWTGERVTGPTDATAAAPLDTIPLYVRAGAPVPMLHPKIDTLFTPTADMPDQHAASDPGGDRLWIRVAPGPSGAFTTADGVTVRQAPAAV
ncbi:MAG: glycoside hydrolase family 31 protein, partial [Deltaproteobacteria bacterium]